ncbi:MAG: hypothetical protein ACJAZ4_002564 [Neptuniibacter pectenicola]
MEPVSVPAVEPVLSDVPDVLQPATHATDRASATALVTLEARIDHSCKNLLAFPAFFNVINAAMSKSGHKLMSIRNYCK